MGGFNIGAAGAAASGFQRGLENFQQGQERQQRMTLADAQMKRQQKLLEREDSDYAAQQEANQEGIRTLEERRKTYESDAAAGARTLEGTQAPGAPTQPWQPAKKDLLAAERAAYDKLYKLGKYDAFQQRFAKAEALRSGLRQQQGQQVIAAMTTGGDITAQLREYDDLMDDGLEVLEAMPVKGKDGKPAYRLRQKNRLTGKAQEPVDVSAEDLQMKIATSMADPKAMATLNLQAYQANAKAALEEKKQTGLDKRQTAKDESAFERQSAHDLSMADRAKEVAQISAGATLGAAKIRAGADGGDNGDIKTLGQANRAVETARNALHQANTAAANILLKGDRTDRMQPQERAALVDADPQVKEARAEYQRALGVRNTLATKRSGLSDAGGPAATAGQAPPPNMLKDGVNTKFKNGQVWTLQNGKAVRVN